MLIPVYKSGIHFGEEKIIPGNKRSGMIVFSGCHLKCNFCYTPETSVHKLGSELSIEEFFQLLKTLVREGAENINLISPTHVWRSIEPALEEFKQKHAQTPIIAKISGFETLSTIERMAKLVDFFVPDFKVFSSDSADRCNLPSRYGHVASAAIARLIELRKPTLVRHLLMPGFEEDSKRVVGALAQIGLKEHLNVMTHFISPEKGLLSAPNLHAEALLLQASQAGINVLKNGHQWNAHERIIK